MSKNKIAATHVNDQPGKRDKAPRGNVVSFRKPLTPGEKFQFFQQVRADHSLSKLGLHIALVIVDHQNNEPDNPQRGYAWLGNPAIAELCGVSANRISVCLAELRKAGHIGSRRRFDNTSLHWPILKERHCENATNEVAECCENAISDIAKTQQQMLRKHKPIPTDSKPLKETIKATREGFEEFCRLYGETIKRECVTESWEQYRELIELGMAHHEIIGAVKDDQYSEGAKAAQFILQASQWLEIRIKNRRQAQRERDRAIAESEAMRAREIANNEPPGFSEAWKHYPKKTGIKLAMEAYRQALGSGATESEILQGVKRYARQFNGDNPASFAQKPVDWFTNRGWQAPKRIPHI
jgi:hypothetical protein